MTNSPFDSADVLSVVVSHTEDIAADRVDLFVTVRGLSVVTGGAALTKAREVAQLVSELKAVGVAESDIHLQGVSAETTTGTLLKSSTASYRLKIRCADLEKLADILGVVTSQKNAALSSLGWLYPDDDARRAVWLDDCLRRANARAARIAAGLGVQIVGVHRFSESYHDEEDGSVLTLGADFGSRRSVAMTSEDLGLEVSHVKRVQLYVSVDFRVSGYDAPKEPS